jgi:hypothetical protein
MKTLNEVPEALVRLVLDATRTAGIEFVLYDPRLGTRPKDSVDTDLALLWLLNRDRFWMEYHQIGPGQYEPWRKHMERADESGYVSCLSPTTKGRPCRNRFPMQYNPHKYDPAVDDHCKAHQAHYSDLRG